MASNMLWFENNGARSDQIDMKGAQIAMKRLVLFGGHLFWSIFRACLGESKPNSFAHTKFCLLMHQWSANSSNSKEKSCCISKNIYFLITISLRPKEYDWCSLKRQKQLIILNFGFELSRTSLLYFAIIGMKVSKWFNTEISLISYVSPGDFPIYWRGSWLQMNCGDAKICLQ